MALSRRSSFLCCCRNQPTHVFYPGKIADGVFACLKGLLLLQLRPLRRPAIPHSRSLGTLLFFVDEGRPPLHPIRLLPTFPFPPGFETDSALEAAGEAYHDFRAQLMIERNEGLTKTYNRFHDPDRERPRHRAPARAARRHGRAVLDRLRWDDLAASARPEFIEQEADEGKAPKTRLDWPAAFKDEVLARLLVLNAERAAAERAAGLSPADAEDDDLADEDEAA